MHKHTYNLIFAECVCYREHLINFVRVWWPGYWYTLTGTGLQPFETSCQWSWWAPSGPPPKMIWFLLLLACLSACKQDSKKATWPTFTDLGDRESHGPRNKGRLSRLCQPINKVSVLSHRLCCWRLVYGLHNVQAFRRQITRNIWSIRYK